MLFQGKLSLTPSERELRRRTYTVSRSDIQSAIALIPVEPTAPTSTLDTAESCIEISGDEDDFDDVFMFENGELFKQDVEAILAALKQASEPAYAALPAPPESFADQVEPVEVVQEEVEEKQPRRGARITKPETLLKKPLVEEEKKVVRGKRKPLYLGARTTTGILSGGNINKSPAANTKKTKIAQLSNARKIETKVGSKISKASAPQKENPSVISSRRTLIPNNNPSTTKFPTNQKQRLLIKKPASNNTSPVSSPRTVAAPIDNKKIKRNVVKKDSPKVRPTPASLPLESSSKDFPALAKDGSSNARVVSPSAVLHRAAG